MDEQIRFYIPKSETIPTELRLYVGDVYVTYERTDFGFLFEVFLDDGEKALNIVKKIIRKIEAEQSEPQYGVSWRTVSLNVVPKVERWQVGTQIEWEYRVRDSY